MASSLVLNVNVGSVIASSEPETVSQSIPTTSPADVVYNGSFSQRIEFKLPEQRGLQPRLGLSYDSGRVNAHGPGNLVGAGWRLTGLSSIQRANHRRAIPQFESSDIWMLDGQELVPCGSYTGAGCGSGATHASLVENYQRIKQDTSNNTWEVTQRDGIRHIYKPLGAWAPEATIPVSGDKQTQMLTKYRYLLAEKIDTVGQKVTYTYSCGNNLDCRITKIKYGIGEVRFHWESRPDVVTYAAGHMLGKSATRLRTVEVHAAGSMLRTYELSYAISSATGRSLLASVRERGRDSAVGTGGVVTGGTALPPYTFQYSGAAPAPKRVADGQSIAIDIVSSSAGSGTICDGNCNPDPTLRGRALASLNNDRDLQWIEVRASGVTRINNGSGDISYRHHCYVTISGQGTVKEFMSELDYSDPGYGCPIKGVEFHFLKTNHSLARGYFFNYEIEKCYNAGGGDQNCRWEQQLNPEYGSPDVIGDFDGDGLDDAIDIEDNLGQRRVRFADGRTSWGNVRDSGFSAYDINGDGLSDSYHRDQANVEVRYSNGQTGFSGAAFSRALSSMYHEYVAIGDFNGDGTRDFVRALNNSGLYRIAYVVGEDFVDGPDVTLEASCVNGQSCSKPYAADVNGDGRDDLIVGGWYSKSRSPNKINGKVYINRAGSFSLLRRASDVAETFNGAIGGIQDADQDGIQEIALDADIDKAGYGAQRWTVISEKPDLLNFLKTPLGAETKVAYAYHEPKTQVDLPLSLFVVKSLETYDGRRVRAKTNYDYLGARWNWAERQFLGFEKITATLPKNSSEAGSPVVETTYMQDLASIGKVMQVVRKDASGTVLQKRVETYAVNTDSKPYTSLNTQTDVTTYYDGVARTKRDSRHFNAFGLVDKTTQHGDVSKIGDERIHTRWPYPNKTKYIVNRWAVEAINAGTAYHYTNDRMWRQWHYYDGANSSVDTAPQKGLKTQTSEWTGGSAEDKVAQVITTYDAVGNVVTEADALGNTTRYVYDSTYKLFPEEIRNPLYTADSRQKKKLTWDKVCGVIRTETDENGSVTTHTYDQLCRKTRTDLPGGGRIKYGYTNWGSPGSSYNRTSTLHPNGTGEIVQDVYFDGFGRTWMEETSG